MQSAVVENLLEHHAILKLLLPGGHFRMIQVLRSAIKDGRLDSKAEIEHLFPAGDEKALEQYTVCVTPEFVARVAEMAKLEKKR